MKSNYKRLGNYISVIDKREIRAYTLPILNFTPLYLS